MGRTETINGQESTANLQLPKRKPQAMIALNVFPLSAAR